MIFHSHLNSTKQLAKCFLYQSCSKHKRYIFSKTRSWPYIAKIDVQKEVDAYWQNKIKFDKEKFANAEKHYIIPMFPYPSGKLHMGHVRIYTISDVLARFQRFRGYNVIHPIGWDSFGLPAENAAIENNEEPEKWTLDNITIMKKQLLALGFDFDWEREISTSNPDYYKWTQFLFLKLFENGLAYRREDYVNWDPVDKTVLANEQVDDKGCAWRSGAKVEIKKLKQWFIKTTVFSKPLSEYLYNKESSGWPETALEKQRFWIGECNGFIIEFLLAIDGQKTNSKLPVWTDKLEFLYGTSFLVVSSDHFLNDESIESNKLKCNAINPLTGEEIPIFVNNDFEYNRFSSCKLGIPSIDKIDEEFAQNNNLKYIKVLENTEDEFLSNSEEFTGFSFEEARNAIFERLKPLITVYQASSTLRDWLVSRQRYWGTPIPVVYCQNCGTVPVPYEDLPVLLPKVDSLVGDTVTSRLSKATDWMNTKCPKCGNPAKRETDTLDTFMDSSWYFLRYLDPRNDRELISKEKSAFMPVDLYIGGIEHATRHLYFARFISHFCHSLGIIDFKEPFSKIVFPQLVEAMTYQNKNGKYLKPDEIETHVFNTHNIMTEKKTGLPVIKKWDKMSKSKHNGINPMDVIEEFGIDAVRFHILNTKTETKAKWDSDGLDFIIKTMNKLWSTVSMYRDLKLKKHQPRSLMKDNVNYDDILNDDRNRAIRKITNLYLEPNLFYLKDEIFNLCTKMRKMPQQFWLENNEFHRTFAATIIVSGPIMPHFASELWEGFRSCAKPLNQHYDLGKFLFEQNWPEIDDNYKFCLKVIINDSIKEEYFMEKKQFEALTKEEALKLAFNSDKLKKVQQDAILEVEHQIENNLDYIINIKVMKAVKKNKK